LLSLLFHGRVELACIRGYAIAPTKPHKLGVYYSGGASYLSCSDGSCISCSSGGIHRGVHGILRARIWCAFTLILPLADVVLRLGAASLDLFGDPAYSDLHDPVRGPHGD
jgi:hypothetical protein